MDATLIKPTMVETAVLERMKRNSSKVIIARGEGLNTEMWVEDPGDRMAFLNNMLQLRLKTKDGEFEGTTYAHLTTIQVRKLHKVLSDWLAEKELQNA